jgi:hypothetical protein
MRDLERDGIGRNSRDVFLFRALCTKFDGVGTSLVLGQGYVKIVRKITLSGTNVYADPTVLRQSRRAHNWDHMQGPVNHPRHIIAEGQP